MEGTRGSFRPGREEVITSANKNTLGDKAILKEIHLASSVLEKSHYERVANLDEKIDKVDQRIAKREDAIERRGQTSTTKAQKPAATTGAKHSPG